MRLPIAWNLAGGYQTNLRKVLDIHDNTMLECLVAYSARSLRGRMNSKRNGAGAIQRIKRKVRIAGSMKA
jgi:hypothetical protein